MTEEITPGAPAEVPEAPKEEEKAAHHPLAPDKPPIGQETQFKKGETASDPRHSSQAGNNKPWSVRMALKYLAAQEVDPTDTQAINRMLANKKMPLAHIIALKSLSKAVGGDMRAIEFATDNLDGKLPQSNINADLNKITTMSDDELRAELAAGLARIAEVNGDATGSGAPRPDSEAAAAPDTAGTAGSVPGAMDTEAP